MNEERRQPPLLARWREKTPPPGLERVETVLTRVARFETLLSVASRGLAVPLLASIDPLASPAGRGLRLVGSRPGCLLCVRSRPDETGRVGTQKTPPPGLERIETVLTRGARSAATRRLETWVPAITSRSVAPSRSWARCRGKKRRRQVSNLGQPG